MATDSGNIHANHRNRMRQRIIKDGIESLQDHELLEYILYAFIPRKDTNPIAHNLINAAGSLDNVFNASVELLLSVPNMTRSAALFLTSMPKIFKRYSVQRAGDKPVFNNSQDAMRYFKQLFDGEMEEHIYLAIVAPSGIVLDISRLSSGDADQCKLDIKKLILKTASAQAKNIIIAHNHPSGFSSPSFSDFEFTRWLVSFAESLGLSLMDHIIVAKNGCYSFRNNGALEVYADEYKNFCRSSSFDDKFR